MIGGPSGNGTWIAWVPIFKLSNRTARIMTTPNERSTDAQSTADRIAREAARIHAETTVNRSVMHGVFCIERVYPVSRAQVFKALTDPAAKAKWFGGGTGFTVLARTTDVRPG